MLTDGSPPRHLAPSTLRPLAPFSSATYQSPTTPSKSGEASPGLSASKETVVAIGVVASASGVPDEARGADPSAIAGAGIVAIGGSADVAVVGVGDATLSQPNATNMGARTSFEIRRVIVPSSVVKARAPFRAAPVERVRRQRTRGWRDAAPRPPPETRDTAASSSRAATRRPPRG